MNLKELQEKRGVKFGELSAILEKAKAEKRSLNDEEKTKFDELENDLGQIDEEIRRLTRFFELSGSNAQPVVSDGEKRDLGKFSFLRAIALTLRGRALDGVEAEMHQEGLKQYRDAGLPVQGNLVIPQMVLAHSEARDL